MLNMRVWLGLKGWPTSPQPVVKPNPRQYGLFGVPATLRPHGSCGFLDASHHNSPDYSSLKFLELFLMPPKKTINWTLRYGQGSFIPHSQTAHVCVARGAGFAEF
jgi:hypothetical protein